MTRRVVRALLVAFSAVIVMVGPVLASDASDVTITVTGVNGVETFTTDGGGGLCLAGTSENFFEKFGGSFVAGVGRSFHGYKVLTCDDGTGSFTITYDAATHDGSPQDQGGWHFAGGTGDYEGVKGGGNLVGTYTDDGIVDVNTGRVTIP